MWLVDFPFVVITASASGWHHPCGTQRWLALYLTFSASCEEYLPAVVPWNLSSLIPWVLVFQLQGIPWMVFPWFIPVMWCCSLWTWGRIIGEFMAKSVISPLWVLSSMIRTIFQLESSGACPPAGISLSIPFELVGKWGGSIYQISWLLFTVPIWQLIMTPLALANDYSWFCMAKLVDSSRLIRWRPGVSGLCKLKYLVGFLALLSTRCSNRWMWILFATS